MRKTNEGAPDANTTTGTEGAAPVQVVCKVKVNGALIEGAHHSINKLLTMDKAKADVLVELKLVEIIGVA